MPYYKRVPEKYRARRFQMNKLRIITRDCEEEAEANRLRAIAEQEAIEQTVALSQLEDDNPKKRSKMDDE
eukprot:3664839-Amphidinium_carterae.1